MNDEVFRALTTKELKKIRFRAIPFRAQPGEPINTANLSRQRVEEESGMSIPVFLCQMKDGYLYFSPIMQEEGVSAMGKPPPSREQGAAIGWYMEEDSHRPGPGPKEPTLLDEFLMRRNRMTKKERDEWEKRPLEIDEPVD